MCADNNQTYLLFFSIVIGTLCGAIISTLISLYFHYVNIRDADKINDLRDEYNAILKSQLRFVTLCAVLVIIALFSAMVNNVFILGIVLSIFIILIFYLLYLGIFGAVNFVGVEQLPIT
ncbi:hypothetical protein [uncultured Methanolobus sp.]|uniref:hypothetical protein n=1 Tax=uncultured Methanolobus sp. TaxID=218300 RepID=UPI002AABDC5A|nr:hypothetical protein [uncultured Methanolobus sp.]